MKIKILFLLLLILPQVLANSHYSYEHTEELTSLIDWRSYEPNTFKESLDENKPIFLLLTAPSWCYWCQVYESEDYLFHPSIVEKINSEYIPIYVDADQRQDLTRQYLEGGWPSTTIMLPSRERLLGFSGARPPQLLMQNLEEGIAKTQGKEFTERISYSYTKKQQTIPEEMDLKLLISGYTNYLLRSYDTVHGGFGTGQKFPQGRSLDYALEIYETTNDERFLNLVKNTLANQYTNINELETNYNLFDPIEGGFHRYGTTREWTPPHYEKMLYDNARLLRVYYHLKLIEEYSLVNEVVDKTLSFIETNWYNPEGTFYGNSDVHGEQHYYAENPRPEGKPRVEKTVYTNWNSEAVITYSYLFQKTENPKYEEMSTKTLNFFKEDIEQGAYHYYKDDEKGVRGNLLDNSYLLLAFIQGYESLNNEEYLDAAKTLADYSLDKLYDWNSGGFFERNSPDTKIYAPGENLLLTNPIEENGIMSYSMIKLYLLTENLEYLNAGIKTLGSQLDNIGGLDRNYYYIKSSELILENNLLQKYYDNEEIIKKIELEKQENFWADNLIELYKEEKTSILLIGIIALIAGFISFASPCSLPILPAFVAYSLKARRKNLKGMTVAFFLGLSIIFTILGMTATTFGSFLKTNLTVFSQIAGILIITFGIYILFGKGFSGIHIKQKKPTTYFGSFLFGGVMGISWTPCVGPILASILLLSSTLDSTLKGGLLLFLYAVGLGIPLIILSTVIDKRSKKGKIWLFIKGKILKFKIFNKTFKVHSTTLISALIFIILGMLIFSGKLIFLQKYVSTGSIQKTLLNMEQALINL